MMSLPQVLSGLLFLACLFLIFSEKLNRTITAMVGAVIMVGLGKLLHFYSQEQAVEAIDFNTVGLLLGMMTLVALLEPTGLFQFLAVWAGRLSRGSPKRLLILLGVVTTVLSMFLDNVTTVVLIAPVTILISEILGMNATPLLVAEALLSNTGGTATLIGDPPNVLIASAAGFSFVDFLTHSLPIVAVTWLVALGLLLWLFRKELSQVPMNSDAMMQLRPEETIRDRKTMLKTLMVLGVAIGLFLVAEPLELSPSFIALGAGAMAFVWVRPQVNDALKRVDWSVLIFFIALFVMVGGLEASGLLHGLARVMLVGKELPGVLFGVSMIWVTSVLSAVVDNVPITIALIPVLEDLALQGVNVNPLWWALAFGAGFGGNATIIGSTANIIVVALSEKTRTPITARLWNRRGLPVMLVTCAVASLLYALMYPLLQQ